VNAHDLEVLSALRDALDTSHSAYLVTVLETWGASPRPVGSIMVYDPDARRVYGSVSGGCVEDDLLLQLQAEHEADKSAVTTSYPRVEVYGAATGYALPCGAQLKILLEKFDPTSTHIHDLLSRLKSQDACARVVTIDASNTATLQNVASDCVEPGLVLVSESQSQGKTTYKISYTKPLQLLIVGAGDVASYLVPLAQQIGYHVTVCEPRSEVNQRVSIVHDIVHVKDCLPDDLVAERFMGAHCAIVALAHDPRVDDLALIAALQGEAHFVGALGSRKNARLRHERLRVLGVNADALANLHAPIGLNIGSRTPPEIAISIAAQLLEQKSKRISNSSPVSSIAKLDACVDNTCMTHHA